MEAAAAADQNSGSTAAIVADFVISYALQLAALLVYLQIHLIKLCAVLIDGLCAHLLSSLNQILPPGSRIHSIHHYLTEFEALATAYLDNFLAKYCEIKLEESIRYMEARKREYESIKPETARGVIAVCFTVAIGFVCVRLWRCGTRSKMMKAPGRGGATMRRSDFAGDPKGYFRSIRSRN